MGVARSPPELDDEADRESWRSRTAAERFAATFTAPDHRQNATSEHAKEPD